MQTRTLLPVALLAALTACTTISQAPEGSPRIETEVVSTVNASVHEALDFSAVEFSAEQRFDELLEPMSDLGMRFYAVPDTEYQQGHARAQYVLTVELSELEPMLVDAELEEEGVVRPITEFESVECRVIARFERRREYGPALIIGRSEGTSQVSIDSLFSVERDPVPMIPLGRQPDTGEFFELREDDFNDLVRRATLRALRQLEPAVDRELSLLEGPGPS